MFTSIVVGTDGSETAVHAVARATELARQFHAQLHIVSACQVVDPLLMASAAAVNGLMVSPIDVPEGSAIDETQTMLDHLADPIEASGVAVATWPCRGGAVAAILDVAEKQRADLIVVGGRVMTGARRILGSVPNSVAHKADCAVLIVKTD